MTRRDLPNLITGLRILLVAPLVWLMAEGRFGWALAVAVVAGASDALDGFLAKRYGWNSRLGGILDPVADKLMLVLSFVALGVAGLLPMWLVVLVLMRDAIIVIGAIVFSLAIATLQPMPTVLSKLNTLLQIVLLLSVLVSQIFDIFPLMAIVILIWVTAATTAASGLQYVWVWGRRAWDLSWQADQEDRIG